MRDYGTATWEGGDADCDHVEQYTDPTKAACSGGITNKRPELEGQQTASKAGRKQFRDVCGKCGAKRIDQQLGLEKTPEEYVAKMVAIFAEVKRVLKPEGTLWLNLGDCYAHSGACGGGSALSNPTDGRKGDQSPRGRKDDRIAQTKIGGTLSPGLKPKDLVGIPWMVAFALRQAGWYLRQDIIWHKPNPMPESVTDRCTKAHEYIFLLTKKAKYYYDADAVREKTGKEATVGDYKDAKESQDWTANRGDTMTTGVEYGRSKTVACTHPAGRNKRSVWTVTTKSYSEAHFATFPPDLITPCVQAGCPKEVCKKCGKARKRIVENKRLNRTELPKDDPRYRPNTYAGAYGEINGKGDAGYKETKTTGWTDCGCGAGFEPGVVLDCFMGSGTVGEVAAKNGRNYVGCELNQKYIDLGRIKAVETGVPVKEQKKGQMALFEVKQK